MVSAETCACTPILASRSVGAFSGWKTAAKASSGVMPPLLAAQSTPADDGQVEWEREGGGVVKGPGEG